MSGHNGVILKNMTYNGMKVKKWFHDGARVFSAGSIVTYVVDSGVSYAEEVDSGASCLSPTSFTPAKDGWTFLGWREDTVADPSVLTSKVMDSEPITLWAVYGQETSCTFISGDNKSSQVVKGTRYYNAAGNTINPSIKAPSGASVSGWTWRGWGGHNDTAANATAHYANGASVPGVSSPETHYGLYQKTTTETFVSWDGSNGHHNPVASTAYYNSAGNTVYSNITAPDAAAWGGWSFAGWGYPNDGGFSVNVTPGQSWTSTADCVRSAIYHQNIHLAYNGNGATGGSVSSQNGTRMCNVVAGNYSNPTFTLAANGFSRTGYGFTGWNLGAPGTTITLDSNRTAYAQWTYNATPFNIPDDYTPTFNCSADCNYGGFFTYSETYFSIEQHSESYWIDGTMASDAFNRNGCRTMSFNIPHVYYMNGGYAIVGFGGVTMNVSQPGDYSLDISNAPEVGSVTIYFPGLQANRAIHLVNIRFS